MADGSWTSIRTLAYERPRLARFLATLVWDLLVWLYPTCTIVFARSTTFLNLGATTTLLPLLSNANPLVLLPLLLALVQKDNRSVLVQALFRTTPLYAVSCYLKFHTC